ncbi:arylsulfatase [Isosphaeraceae bacterium EP7]
MKRTMLRALFALGLGSGLGYLVAAGGLGIPRTALAANEPMTRSTEVTTGSEAKSSCSEGLSRNALLALATTAVQPTQAAPAQAKKKPNIVVIWGDDIGQSNVSAYSMGVMGYRTPNIDRVAKEGMIFTDYYAEQSCTAGRASFITGQHGLRTGLTKVGLPGATLGLQKEDPTIAELLKPHGYATGQFGKNHLGDRNAFLPTVHGFDEFYGNLYHLNAEEEPENRDYPKDPAFRQKYGPRGVMDSKATETDDATVDPRFGKIGKQVIKDTGPLTKKRMETIDDDTAARAVDFMERKAKEDKPFFLWVNFTHMHFRTHPKPESQGQSGRWQSEYHDAMIDHDKNVGTVLDAIDRLKLGDDTFVMYSTDNGPHMNTWPDAGMTPFRNEKNTNWEGAYRVPAMVRWPGKIKPGTVSNEMVSHHDWLPTFLAMAGDGDVKEKLLKGHAVGDTTYKVHLDGYNLVPYLAGQAEKSPRESFVYCNDDQQVTGLRFDNWKLVFLEQRVRGTLQVWAEPFVNLRVPKLFNLRTDPYERADVTSNTYYDWLFDHIYLFVPAQDYVGKFLMTFKDFPQRQKAASFNLDEVLEKLKEASSQ